MEITFLTIKSDKASSVAGKSKHDTIRSITANNIILCTCELMLCRILIFVNRKLTETIMPINISHQAFSDELKALHVYSGVFMHVFNDKLLVNTGRNVYPPQGLKTAPLKTKDIIKFNLDEIQTQNNGHLTL